MDDYPAELSIDELVERSGVPARTIRYYISQGLLPGAGTRGRGAAYSEEHLLRLRLIRRLVERRVPLAEIRTQLAGISVGEIRALLAREDRHAAEVAAAGTPKEYVARLLERTEGAAYAVPPPPAAAAPLPNALRAAPVESGTTPQPAPVLEAWRRVELAPGVELHVRADAERRQRRLIQRVLGLVGRNIEREGERD